MKKTKTKRLCAFLTLLCMLAASLHISIQAAATENATEKTTYAAFGDSIAAGYGLAGYSKDQSQAPAESYQALLAKFLHTQSCNYAVSGDDSNACIELLNSGKADADLEAADVITLSIGSNDLLLPFIQIVMDHFQIQPGTVDASSFENGFTMPQLSMPDLANYYQQAQALAAELADNATLHGQAAAFPQKLGMILSILREKAPQAEIYVTNIYNPFRSVPLFGNLADSYIQEINQAFSADAADYTLIDVYTLFHEDGLTNVHFDLSSPSSMNPDPHPSVAGHKAIGELLVTALKNAHAPKAASLSSLSSKSKTRLTVKVKLPAGADGYQIRYATAKNGNYKTLATASGKIYQTNSGKLKPGKTYYVKVQSYKTVKGVTYYGKNSNVKKVQIK